MTLVSASPTFDSFWSVAISSFKVASNSAAALAPVGSPMSSTYRSGDFIVFDYLSGSYQACIKRAGALHSSMMDLPSSIIPRIASQLLPRACFPTSSKTCSKRSTCTSVSSRYCSNPAFSVGDTAAFAVFAPKASKGTPTPIGRRVCVFFLGPGGWPGLQFRHSKRNRNRRAATPPGHDRALVCIVASAGAGECARAQQRCSQAVHISWCCRSTVLRWHEERP